jgi:hypothetical protein
MMWVRGHGAAVGIVAIALLTTAGVFVFARPRSRPHVTPSPPHEPLPYTKVTYAVNDAQRAFRTARIKLVRHTHRPIPVGAPPNVDLSESGDIVEVDVFGDPRRVAASGFSDYFTFAGGHWVKAPRTCSPGATDAERWRGNVRVVVSCKRAGSAASAWIARIDGALAHLS